MSASKLDFYRDQSGESPPYGLLQQYEFRYSDLIFKRLIKDASRKIFLILDNFRIHHSYVVRDWLKGHKKQIDIFFLSSYSSELNPDEYLNCDLKAGVHSRATARMRDQLQNNAVSHLRKLKKVAKTS